MVAALLFFLFALAGIFLSIFASFGSAVVMLTMAVHADSDAATVRFWFAILASFFVLVVSRVLACFALALEGRRRFSRPHDVSFLVLKSGWFFFRLLAFFSSGLIAVYLFNGNGSELGLLEIGICGLSLSGLLFFPFLANLLEEDSRG